MATTIIQITANTHFPIKLTPTNFPVWRKQILSTLIGLDLDKFIIGTNPCPSKTLAGDETKPNPAYLPWFRQDQIIISAILGSLSDSIQPLVASAETSQQAWEHLNASYASVSRSRIISLKSRLAKNPKGNRTISEFLHEMKAIADELALVQNPIHEEDLAVHIISQLGDEYNHVTAALKVRETPLSFHELFDKLVDFERSLKDTVPSPMITTVNNTQRQQDRSYSRPYSDNRSTNRPSHRSSKQPRPQGNGNNYISNNRGSQNPPFCQFCSIPGHDTKECRKLSRFLRENNINVSTNSSAHPVINTTSAHPTRHAQQWMFDTGASHHVTSDHSSLHTLSEYGGPDEIVLGNGKTLPISHTGHTNLSTHTRPLALSNVFYVPSLRNNLISVAKLCKSNQVSVEFFPYHFLVKDLRTGGASHAGSQCQ
ncbi:hypothetical protein LXL04_038930 [Taraxacum kok-saghyz]